MHVVRPDFEVTQFCGSLETLELSPGCTYSGLL